MCCSKHRRSGVTQPAGIIYACTNLGPRLREGAAGFSHNDAGQKETKLGLSCELSSCVVCLCMWIGAARTFLGCVRVGTSGDQKENKRIEAFWRNVACTVGFQLFASYLKGLTVNRLLLAIVLPSPPPLIILRSQRPPTSLLSSHHRTSGEPTFSPRPIQQRCTRVTSHGRAARRKNESNFYSRCPVGRLWTFDVLLHRQTNTLNSG